MKQLNVIIVLLLFLLCAGCTNPSQETTALQPRIRAALKSDGPDTLKITVFLEGPDGNALSGAIVTVKDNSNALLQLYYDTDNCSYNGVLEAAAGETHYIVEALTILSDTIITLDIPYSSMEIMPDITVFQDAIGNSVLSGQSVVSAQPIQIGWADCGEDVVYRITVKTALKAVYSVSTNACTVTIPAESIPAGVYAVEITAQKIYGDMYFRSVPFYSVSSVTAPMVSCNVD